MQCPDHSGTTYIDYKGHYSTNLLANSGAKNNIIMADVGAPGRHSDGGVFSRSEMGQRFINGTMCVPPPQKISENGPELPYVLVGDEAFALSSYMMKPFARRRNLNLRERVFNYRLSRARRIVECTFGIISAVWRIFRSPLLTKLLTTLQIIRAVICLHNFILKYDPQRQKIRNLANSAAAYDNCFTDLRPATEDEIRNLAGANLYREQFADYFYTEGAISFQWEKAIEADF